VQAGVLVVGAAGNIGTDYPPGVCELTMVAEAPSMLVVGGLDNWSTGAAYWNLGIWPSSSEGGLNVTLGGSLRSRAHSQVGLVITQQFGFAAAVSPTFVPSGGTSLAAPQIAGAGVLLKHWAIANSFSVAANSPGWVWIGC
jgi:hypothetical protein